MTQAEATQILERWLELLNRIHQDTEVLDEGVLVRFYPDGRGGRELELRGPDAVMAWLGRGPHRYAFSAAELRPGEPVEGFPAADFVLAARYTVSFLEGDWSNQGDWTLHCSAGRLLALRHVPERLPDDATIRFDAKTADTGEHESAHDHENESCGEQSCGCRCGSEPSDGSQER